MPLILILILLPFGIFAWVARYASLCLDNRRKMEEEIIKLEIQKKSARPFKDYVASLKPEPPRKIPLRILPSIPVAPTFSNIARFAVLSIRSSGIDYFVRDEEGHVYGPADEATVRSWILEGRIHSLVLASSSMNGPWLPLGSIRAFTKSVGSADLSSPAGNTSRFENLKIR